MLPGVHVVEVNDSSRCQDGVWFVPVLFDFEPGERLARVDLFDRGMMERDAFREVERNCSVDTDSPTFWSVWLRARLTAEFRMQPLVAGDNSRTSVLDIGFFAAIFAASGEPAFHPFVCTEAGGDGPELEFLTSASTADEQKQIVSAFRSLTLASPFDLVPFADYVMLDYDYDAWFVKLGLDTRGRFFELGVAGYDEEDLGGWNDGHTGLPGYESRECDHCGGQGEESFLPAGEQCEICQGSGRLSWVEPWSAVRKRRQKTAFRDW
jgi:hypothetical protein